MNLIFGMKVIYLMRLDSLVKIVVERCTRNTTKVPTVWNINYQIIKNNNTTTQKRHRGVFPRCFSYSVTSVSSVSSESADSTWFFIFFVVKISMTIIEFFSFWIALKR